MRYYLAATDLSSLIDLSIKLFKNNKKPLLTLGLLANLPGLVLLVLNQYGFFDAYTEEFVFMEGMPPWQYSWLLDALSMGSWIFIAPLASGAMVVLLAADIFGAPVSISDGLRHAWQHKLAIWGSTALFFCIFYPSILLIIPGIYFLLRYSLLYHVIILEHLGGLPSFGRSGRLMRGFYWKLLAIIAIIYSMLFGTITLLGVSMQGMPGVVGLLAWGVQILWLAAYTVVCTTVYFAARCEHEQLDVTLANAAANAQKAHVAEQATTPPAPNHE